MWGLLHKSDASCSCGLARQVFRSLLLRTAYYSYLRIFVIYFILYCYWKAPRRLLNIGPLMVTVLQMSHVHKQWNGFVTLTCCTHRYWAVAAQSSGWCYSLLSSWKWNINCYTLLGLVCVCWVLPLLRMLILPVENQIKVCSITCGKFYSMGYIICAMYMCMF